MGVAFFFVLTAPNVSVVPTPDAQRGLSERPLKRIADLGGGVEISEINPEPILYFYT